STSPCWSGRAWSPSSGTDGRRWCAPTPTRWTAHAGRSTTWRPAGGPGWTGWRTCCATTRRGPDRPVPATARTPVPAAARREDTTDDCDQRGQGPRPPDPDPDRGLQRPGRAGLAAVGRPATAGALAGPAELPGHVRGARPDARRGGPVLHDRPGGREVRRLVADHLGDGADRPGVHRRLLRRRGQAEPRDARHDDADDAHRAR